MLQYVDPMILLQPTRLSIPIRNPKLNVAHGSNPAEDLPTFRVGIASLSSRRVPSAAQLIIARRSHFAVVARVPRKTTGAPILLFPAAARRVSSSPTAAVPGTQKLGPGRSEAAISLRLSAAPSAFGLLSAPSLPFRTAAGWGNRSPANQQIRGSP